MHVAVLEKLGPGGLAASVIVDVVVEVIVVGDPVTASSGCPVVIVVATNRKQAAKRSTFGMLHNHCLLLLTASLGR